MEKLIEFRSAMLLESCLLNLKESLNQKYDPYPLNPEKEFTSSAQRTIEAIGLVLRDILKRLPDNTNMTGAAVLAIELGDYDLAEKCVETELKRLQHDDVISGFRRLISITIENRGLDSRWQNLNKMKGFT